MQKRAPGGEAEGLGDMFVRSLPQTPLNGKQFLINGDEFFSMGAAALRYAELGYPVFPCVPGGKAPFTRRGFKDASTASEQIEAWWRQHPNANIGLATTGLLVVDIDGPENPWLGDDPEKCADLARGAVARTPHGGRHYVFRQPPGRTWGNSCGRLAPQVDTRGHGGYIVVPPSVIDGKVYSWVETFELDMPPALPNPPEWLVGLLDGDIGLSPQCEDSPVNNMIPSGQRNSTLTSVAGSMRRIGLSADEILAALQTRNRNCCQPRLPDAEVASIAASVARYEPDQVSVAFVSAEDLCHNYQQMRQPVIHGLLRAGETMNVIGPPKSGKSWLALALGISAVTGRPWLGRSVEPGHVLIIDNELHAETLAHRIQRVADAMRLREETWKKRLHVLVLRGRIEDQMQTYFQALPTDFFHLIILDSLYRFLPPGMSENDNATMAGLYNVIDRCAAKLSAAFVLIHHTTKGLQSSKGITDVGAGAGAQSRAADCHLVLRPHAEEGCLSVDAVARSWPPPKPCVIRHSFPLWIPDPGLDPKDLTKPYQRKRADGPEKPTWTPEKFVARFIDTEPKTKAAMLAAANGEGLSDYRAGKLLRKGEATGLIHRWHLGGNRPGFATRPQEMTDGSFQDAE